MDIADKFFGIGLFGGGGFGGLGGCRGDSGFVVETIQVAAGLLEFLDPFLGLNECIISQNPLVIPLKQCRFNIMLGQGAQINSK